MFILLFYQTRQKNKPCLKGETGGRSEDLNAEFNFTSEIRRVHNLSGCAKNIKSFHNNLKTQDETKKAGAEIESETGNNIWVYETKTILSPVSETHSSNKTHTSTFSSQPDTDIWSEYSDGNFKGKFFSLLLC